MGETTNKYEVVESGHYADADREVGEIVDLTETDAAPLVESGAGAAGSAAKASREDHIHPAASVGTAHYLVIASSHSTPLIFGDLVQTTAGDDLIYTT